jgi:hypothetical protein
MGLETKREPEKIIHDTAASGENDAALIRSDIAEMHEVGERWVGTILVAERLMTESV